MTKQTFLKNLETKLSENGIRHIADIIAKYEAIIEVEMESGKEEKETIEELGSIDDIVKTYKEKQEKDDNFITRGIDRVNATFDNINGETAKKALKIIFYVFFVFVIVSLLQIPFEIGHEIFNYSSTYSGNLLSISWGVGFGLMYIIFIGWVIYTLVVKVLPKNMAPHTQSEAKPHESGTKGTTTILDALVIVLKVLAFMFTIPLLCAQFGLFIALCVMIVLLASGVLLYGPMIFIIGVMLFVSLIIDLIFTGIFKGGLK